MKLFRATIGYAHHPVLRDVSLDIQPGEWVFLVGASGSGKTSILQTLFGLLPPHSGACISDAGKDIYKFSKSALRAYQRTGGMIFQDPTLIDYKTVIENISYAMEICNYAHETIGPRALQLLDQVGMLAKKDIFPNSLSGGEAQRVAVARALIHEPRFILADEPTAHLDKKNIHSIIDILRDVNSQGTTIVFATHDQSILSLVPHARVVDISEFVVKSRKS